MARPIAPSDSMTLRCNTRRSSGTTRPNWQAQNKASCTRVGGAEILAVAQVLLAFIPAGDAGADEVVDAVIDDAVSENGGNLAGSIRDVNPLGGTQNCINCVIAGDATLSGSAASALDSAGPQSISILENTYGGTFKIVSGQSEIEQMLSDAGPGARGIVYGERAEA